MTRHEIAPEAEFDDGSRVIREIDGLEIAVFKIDGEYYALANYCVHQAGPLCQGELMGRVTMGEEVWEWKYDTEERYVLCPWHGWVFDVTTGVNVDADQYAVPTYSVEVDDGMVYVLR